tara:strand:- start:438 stop:1193 length:756 start_codon:yes stop_codon:yes gene_type:complete
VYHQKIGIKKLSQFDQIAFFWIGNDILIPTYLVKSINLVYNRKVKIFHLTNFITKKIPGTTKTIRLDLSKDIMIARIQAYKNFTYNKNLTFFCDADSLFIQQLNLFDLKQDMYFVKRSENFIMNHMWPEYYPEFVNKNAIDLMPYLFGAMAFRNGKNFFTELLDTCLNLPERFHRWYGDQYSLAINLKKNGEKLNLLPIELYLKIVRKPIIKEDLNLYFNKNVKLITFKGENSKKFIHESYINLVNYYESK